MIENEINNFAEKIFNLAIERKTELEKQSAEFLKNLKHYCSEKENNFDFSVRTSAKMTGEICDLILEARA